MKEVMEYGMVWHPIIGGNETTLIMSSSVIQNACKKFGKMKCNIS